MKGFLITAALAFLGAVSLYGLHVSTGTHTLGMSRLGVIGLGFVGCFSLLLALIAFFVNLFGRRRRPAD